MPTLIIEHADQVHGVVLDGRLLIGRAAPGGIVIPDPAVSRIHAWIDRTASGFYIADADSRTGTILADVPLRGRHTLVEGDVIRVGPATIRYHDQTALPEGIVRMPTAHAHDLAISAAGGILFACTCGAPLWAPLEWEGRSGKCAHCGQRTPVPGLPRPRRPQAVPQPQRESHETQTCSICQWKIELGEPRTDCPTCGLTFHAECWQENKGCSAYGCASVNALVEKGSETDAASQPNAITEVSPVIIDETPEPFPVEMALLGGSVVASVIGLVAFGLPSLAVAVWGIIIAVKHRTDRRMGLIAGAVAFSLLGCGAGLWLSAFKWLHHPLAAPWQHG
ncbi:MAG: FHA domain-containing protein [Phycisphaerae bacterium]|nr:FHA domain-containing protein [Phycisphaerae bacterium]